MSDTIAGPRGWQSKLADRDVIAGTFFAIVAATFLIGSFRLPLGTFRNMGPGYFPAITSVCLLLMGFGIVLNGWRRKAEPMESVDLRGMLFLGAAPLLFLVLVDSLGLAPAVLAASFASTFAMPGSRTGGTVTAIGVAIVALVIFKYMLGATDPLFQAGLLGG